MAPLKKRIKNTLIYYLVMAMVGLLRALPRSTALAMMRGFGSLAFTLAGKEREKTIRHLTWAYGQEKSAAEIERMGRAVFRNLAAAAADAFRLPKILDAGINTLVKSKGAERLRQAYDRGKGVIVLTGHFGNWELFGAWVAQNGYPTKVVGRNAYDPRLDRLIVNMRNQAGYTNIARGKGTRELVRALHDHYCIGMLVDQDTKVEGVFVDFFGRPAHTAVGPVILARKFGAAILPAFIHREPDDTYLIEFDEEIILEKSEDEEKDLLINTQKISDAYERAIRRFPEQWVWMHERWKKQPGDMIEQVES